MKKTFVGLLLIIGVLLVGFFLFNNFIYEQKQANDSDTVSPYRGTLTGEYVCLPHKDTKGPQTLECAIGLKTDVGEYYAIDFNLMSQEQPLLQTGQRFTANGVITPIEYLSTNNWEKYDIVGIFSVTDSIEVL